MLRKLNKLEKQHGGAIPFSAMEEKGKSKTKNKKKTPPKKSSHKHKKRSISPSRVHRQVTKKLKRVRNKQRKKIKSVSVVLVNLPEKKKPQGAWVNVKNVCLLMLF